MWDLPGPGLGRVYPALAGGFLTTAPPGKPHDDLLKMYLKYVVYIPFPHMIDSLLIHIGIVLSFYLYNYKVTCSGLSSAISMISSEWNTYLMSLKPVLYYSLNCVICYTAVIGNAEKTKNKLIFSSVIKLLHPICNCELSNIR